MSNKEKLYAQVRFRKEVNRMERDKFKEEKWKNQTAQYGLKGQFYDDLERATNQAIMDTVMEFVKNHPVYNDEKGIEAVKKWAEDWKMMKAKEKLVNSKNREDDDYEER